MQSASECDSFQKVLRFLRVTVDRRDHTGYRRLQIPSLTDSTLLEPKILHPMTDQGHAIYRRLMIPMGTSIVRMSFSIALYIVHPILRFDNSTRNS